MSEVQNKQRRSRADRRANPQKKKIVEKIPLQNIQTLKDLSKQFKNQILDTGKVPQKLNKTVKIRAMGTKLAGRKLGSVIDQAGEKIVNQGAYVAQLLNPQLKFKTRIPNQFSEQTIVCSKEVYLPVTTSNLGTFFILVKPGTRPRQNNQAFNWNNSPYMIDHSNGANSLDNFELADLAALPGTSSINPYYLDGTSSFATRWALQSMELEFVFTNNFNNSQGTIISGSYDTGIRTQKGPGIDSFYVVRQNTRFNVSQLRNNRVFRQNAMVNGATVIYVPKNQQDLELKPMDTTSVLEDAIVPAFSSAEELYMIFQGCPINTNIGYIVVKMTHEFTITPAFAGIMETQSAKSNLEQIQQVQRIVSDCPELITAPALVRRQLLQGMTHQHLNGIKDFFSKIDWKAAFQRALQVAKVLYPQLASLLNA